MNCNRRFFRMIANALRIVGSGALHNRTSMHNGHHRTGRRHRCETSRVMRLSNPRAAMASPIAAHHRRSRATSRQRSAIMARRTRAIRGTRVNAHPKVAHSSSVALTSRTAHHGRIAPIARIDHPTSSARHASTKPIGQIAKSARHNHANNRPWAIPARLMVANVVNARMVGSATIALGGAHANEYLRD
ncbi:MAG: hypothetical protein Fur005_09770 [Roseiflexaceae bacterium]